MITKNLNKSTVASAFNRYQANLDEHFEWIQGLSYLGEDELKSILEKYFDNGRITEIFEDYPLTGNIDREHVVKSFRMYQTFCMGMVICMDHVRDILRSYPILK